LRNQMTVKNKVSCISVLPQIGQSYATIPHQNMHFDFAEMLEV